MSKERYNQLIDEAYKDYCKSFNDSIIEPISKELFIDKCKYNIPYSERRGLRIDERLLYENQGWERYELLIQTISESELKRKYETDERATWIGFRKFRLSDANYICDKENFPTKLITLTYKNETVEIYE